MKKNNRVSAAALILFLSCLGLFAGWRARSDYRWSAWAIGDAQNMNAAVHFANEGFAKHYFLTYKDLPGSEDRACEITHVYGREEAIEVIRRAREDYSARFGQLEAMMASVLED